MTDTHIVFWDCRSDREDLAFTSIEDAVQSWADDLEGPLPEEVTVYGWKRMEIPSAEAIAERVLDDVLERLDEEYGDPDGGFVQPAKELNAAALRFAEEVRTHYVSWMCEQATSRIVRVADYVTERIS